MNEFQLPPEPTKYDTITGEDWRKSILRSRSEPNLLYETIMKLHPQNPTPGLETPVSMIVFESFPGLNGESFRCKSGDVAIGYLHKHEGEYHFFPNNFYGVKYRSGALREIVNMMEALNGPSPLFTD